jgi:leucyl-tRNA synthetase
MLDERAKYWLPVDQYVGGIEHAVMHLLYARFFYKLLRDEGLVNSDEPFIRLLTQGMVLKDGSKMSKSKGNTVDPTDLIGQYGADTVRLFVMFAAPPEQSLEWSDSGVEGSYRFLKRLWNFAYQNKSLALTNKNQDPADTITNSVYTGIRRQIHEILQQARYDYERQQFNTVVSGSMKMLNLLQDFVNQATAHPTDSDAAEKQFIIVEGFSIILRLLAPIAPHITHAIWQLWQFDGLIIHAPFPQVVPEALENDSIELVIQINGKMRGQITVSVTADEAAIKASALANPNIQRHLENQAVKKIILVPKKLINIVI